MPNGEDASVPDIVGNPILIRFDGLDSANHEVEILDLAESLRGLGRIIAVTGNFSATGRWVQHKDAMSVRVVVRPPEAHCFEVYAWIRWGAEQPLISGTLAALTATLVTYVFKRAAGQREEMRLIKDSLDQAIRQLGTRDQGMVERILTTIDKMADALRPAVRQAVSPIGNSARTLTIGDSAEGPRITLDAAYRDAVQADTPPEIGQEQNYTISISELDLQTGSCKFAFAGEAESRHAGQVTDPLLAVPNNPYAAAMAGMKSIVVRGKSAIREGALERLYISDVRHQQD